MYSNKTTLNPLQFGWPWPHNIPVTTQDWRNYLCKYVRDNKHVYEMLTGSGVKWMLPENIPAMYDVVVVNLLDSTLVEGRLGAYSGLRQLLAWTGCSSSRAGSNTRQRMGRLTDSKVRGFMVTETNSEACAQLKLVLHAASTACVTLSLYSRPPLVHLY